MPELPADQVPGNPRGRQEQPRFHAPDEGRPPGAQQVRQGAPVRGREPHAPRQRQGLQGGPVGQVLRQVHLRRRHREARQAPALGEVHVVRRLGRGERARRQDTHGEGAARAPGPGAGVAR